MRFDYMSEVADMVRELAGERFDQLWTSRDAAFRFTADPDSKIRCAALIVAHDKWKCGDDPRFQQVCRDIARSDVGEPRKIAVSLLGQMFSNTKTRDVQRLMLPIIRDDGAEAHVRNNAYRALRQIEYGHDLADVVAMSREAEFLAKGSEPPLASIDWELVDLVEGSE